MAKYLISTKVFGQAAEDANVAAFGKDTFFEKSGEFGSNIGSTVGSALGFDDQLASLERELQIASEGYSMEGFFGGSKTGEGKDPKKVREAYLKAMRLRNEQLGGSFSGTMSGTPIFKLRQSLDEEVNFGKGMTDSEYADYEDARDAKIAAKRKELQVQFQKDKFPEQLKKADEIRDLMIKILETREAREQAMASQNTTVVQNVNNNGANGGPSTGNNNTTSIDLNANRIPGFAQ